MKNSSGGNQLRFFSPLSVTIPEFKQQVRSNNFCRDIGTVTGGGCPGCCPRVSLKITKQTAENTWSVPLNAILRSMLAKKIWQRKGRRQENPTEVVNAVFVQQTMKTASSDEDLAFKQCLDSSGYSGWPLWDDSAFWHLNWWWRPWLRLITWIFSCQKACIWVYWRGETSTQ